MAKQAQHPVGTAPDVPGSGEAAALDAAAGVDAGTDRDATTDLDTSGDLDAPSGPPRAAGLGELLGFSAQGYPVILLAGGREALEVPTTVVLGHDDVGSMVLVTFVDGREDQPVVTGRLLPPFSPDEPPAAPGPTPTGDGPLRIEADGETVTIEAGRELVLRCGKASIRLRRDGRVEVRGVDVVSRAERANWIKGGSVALN